MMLTADAPAPRADSYLPWCRQTVYRDVGATSALSWISLIVRLRAGDDPLGTLMQGLARCEWLRFPGHYASRHARWQRLRHCTVLVTQPTVDMLAGREPPSDSAQRLLWDAVEAFEICFATDLPPAALAPPRGFEFPGKNPQLRVLLGVIDDGIAFANQRFCRRDGDAPVRSRFLAFWDQNGTGNGWPFWPGNCHGQQAIDAAISAASTAGGVLDDERVYRALGYQDVRRRATHGTHVLDLFAGEAPDSDAARDSAIVGVQLPGHAVADTSCGSMAAYVVEALHFIVRASEAADLPAVVNISMGNIAGPHDGSSIFDTALDELVQGCAQTGPGLQIVMPEGNSYLSQCHAQADLGSPKDPSVCSVMELDWIVLPDDGTSSVVELWFGPATKGGVFDVHLSIAAPGGGPNWPVHLAGGQPGDVSRAIVVDGQSVGWLGLYPQPGNGDGLMGLVVLAPTASLVAGRPLARSGRWTLTLEHSGAVVSVNLYVQRDDVAFGRRGRGRQSRLDDQAYRRFNASGRRELWDQAESYVRRVGTMNGMATSRSVHVVGSLLRGTGGTPSQAAYSGVGLKVPLASQKQRTWAISEDSPVLHGILACGTRSGTVAALSGTSTAAPQLARQLAAPPGASRSPGTAITAAVEDAHAALRPVVPLPDALRRRAALRL